MEKISKKTNACRKDLFYFSRYNLIYVTDYEQLEWGCGM